MDSNDSRPFFEGYVQTLRNALAFLAGRIRRNIAAVLLIPVLATAAGFAWWYSRTPYFETELVCAFNNQRVPGKPSARWRRS